MPEGGGMITRKGLRLIGPALCYAGFVAVMVYATVATAEELAATHEPWPREYEQAARAVTQAAIAVRNDPPRILVSTRPAILVAIDGPAILKPVPDTRLQRVVNTRHLILHGGIQPMYYLRLGDGWAAAPSVEGPWMHGARAPLGADQVAKALVEARIVDIPQAAGAPTVFTSTVPAELLAFNGKPAFMPVVGTDLFFATNTGADVFIEAATQEYFVLLAGRWFQAEALSGPWQYVPNDRLPRDFARIPPESRAARVLASVAGTAQARDAVRAIATPQTAAVSRADARFTPVLDGPPQYRPIEGSTLVYVANSPVPIIRVDSSSYYAVDAGVWFKAPSLAGPWVVAASVPAAIYAIPASSPVHYVTYVRVYGASPSVVYVGYTAGYSGAVVTSTGVVVYGTGYRYPAWVGAAYYPAPVAYGYYGGSRYAGTSGSYVAANGTQGSYAAGRSFNPYTGVAQQGAGRTFETANGATGALGAGERYNAHTGVYSASAAGTVTGPNGASVDHAQGYAAGPNGSSARGGTTTLTNPQGESRTVGGARVGDDYYANVNGEAFRNTGEGWEHRGANGEWSAANRPSTEKRATPPQPSSRGAQPPRGGHRRSPS